MSLGLRSAIGRVGLAEADRRVAAPFLRWCSFPPPARLASPRGLARALHQEQRGFSLTEELVSLAVLALAVGVVITGIFTGTVGVRTRHGSVSGQTLARSQMELITDAGYHPDPTAAPYPTVAPVSGFTVEVEVEYWTAPSGPFTSSVRNDGLQRLTVSVSDGDGELQQLEAYLVER